MGEVRQAKMADFRVEPDLRLGFRPALDGIRALAVLPVIVFHGLRTAAPGGFSGVRLFFVLSGFLITTLLLEEWADTGTIKLGAFYMRRALRLLPALFFFLILYVLMVVVVEGPGAVKDLVPDLATVSLYVNNWKLIAVPGDGKLAHLWSLSVEEQFYLLWPIGLVLLARRVTPRQLLIVTGSLVVISWLVCIVLSITGQADGGDLASSPALRHAYYGTDTVAYSLLAGAFLAQLRTFGRLGGPRVDGGAPSVGYRRFLTVAGPAALLVYLVQIVFYPAPYLREVGLLVLTLGFVLLILSVVDAPDAPLTRALSWAPLRAIGRVSYGLYLWHFVVLELLHLEVKAHAPKLNQAVELTVAGVLTAGVVLFSYWCVEQPFLRMKQRWIVDPKAAGHPE